MAMEGMNRVQLIGNIGRDLELRKTKSGSAVLKLSIATTERQKKGEEWVDHTEWHTAVLWGKRAEVIAGIASKGTRVFLEGNLRTNSWEKDGVKRYTTEISVTSIHIMGGRPGGQQSMPATQPASSARSSRDDEPEHGWDDVPF